METMIVSFTARPWVRRAGLSIVITAAVITVWMAMTLLFSRSSRYGWLGEPFAWLYMLTLWAGGLKVWSGSLRTIAEFHEDRLLLRPLHQFGEKWIPWTSVLGTEQTVKGDRLIVYYEGKRGVRFVAVNLNLIRGRRDFLSLLDERLTGCGFSPIVDGETRKLVRAAGSQLSAS